MLGTFSDFLTGNSSIDTLVLSDTLKVVMANIQDFQFLLIYVNLRYYSHLLIFKECDISMNHLSTHIFVDYDIELNVIPVK